MLEEKDLQAIAQLIDSKLAPINDRLDQMQASQDQMQASQDQMQASQDQMQGDLTHVKAQLDYDVNKRLNAINDGIDTILETMVSKSRVEQLEDDVIVLKTAVKMLTQEVAELKKAQ